MPIRERNREAVKQGNSEHVDVLDSGVGGQKNDKNGITGLPVQHANASIYVSMTSTDVNAISGQESEEKTDIKYRLLDLKSAADHVDNRPDLIPKKTISSYTRKMV